MKTIELFSGTKSFSKVAKASGFDTLTIDNDPKLSPDICIDIMKLELLDYPVDILWASPPCTSFSIASVSHHWRKMDAEVFVAISKEANIGYSLIDKTISIIAETKPKLWYIENPRGMMRKMIDRLFHCHNILLYRRVTITYCQYGD